MERYEQVPVANLELIDEDDDDEEEDEEEDEDEEEEDEDEGEDSGVQSTAGKIILVY